MKPQPSVFTAGDSDEEKLGRFIGGSSVAVLSSLVAGVFALGWATLMGNELSAEQYSIVGPYLQVFWILTTIVSFGVPHTLITFISHHHEKDPGMARDIAAQGNRLLFVIGAIFAAVAVTVAVALYLAGVLRAIYLALCLIMVIAVFTRQMYFGLYAAISGIQRLDYAAIANLSYSVSVPFIAIFFLVAVRHLQPGHGALEILAGAGSIGAAAFLSYFVALLVARRTEMAPRVVYARSTNDRRREILTFGWVTNVALVVNTIVSMVPPIFVSYFMAQSFGWFGHSLQENQRQAGIFAIAFTFAMAPLLIIGLTFALLPAMSEAESQGNRRLMNFYFNTSLKYCFSLISLVTCIYASAIGRMVQLITGGKYPEGMIHSVTFVLELGVACSSLAFLFLNMLIGVKRPAAAAWTVCAISVIEVTAMTLAGRLTGSVLLTAAGFTVSLFCGALFFLFYMVRRVGMKLQIGLFPPPLLSAVAAWAVCKAIMPHGPLGILVVCAAAPAVFLLADGLLGGVAKSDLDMMRRTLASLRLGFLAVIVNVLEKIFRISPLFGKE